MKCSEERKFLTTALRLFVCAQMIYIFSVILFRVVSGEITTTPRYTMPTTTIKIKKRTTPSRMSFAENCDYLAYYCLKAYKTGELCGRTIYYRYYDFQNYCMLDFVNCMEGYEVWQVAYMGRCFNITVLTDYLRYEYMDDHFLDQYYVIEH